MKNPQIILIGFVDAGNKLGSRITQSDAEELVQNLHRRLGDASGFLDHSPESLKKLPTILLTYYRERKKLDIEIDDEEIAILVREIASYLGLVLVLQTDGIWIAGENILSLRIEFKRIIPTKKSQKKTIEFSIPLFFTACRCFEALQMDIESKMFLIFEAAKSNGMGEKLS